VINALPGIQRRASVAANTKSTPQENTVLEDDVLEYKVRSIVVPSLGKELRKEGIAAHRMRKT
jgi:hypothetical protein